MPVSDQTQVSDKIKQENTVRMNGARFGMIFNNVIRIYIANDMSMTTSDIYDCFKRVESWVEFCEDDKPKQEITQDEKGSLKKIKQHITIRK